MNNIVTSKQSVAISRTLQTLLAAALVLGALLGAQLTLPSAAHAFNGYLEDCDFDGKDDETGVAVPFPGFDETRGDAVPANWDRVNGRYIEASPPSTETANTGNEPSSGSGSNSGSSSGSTSNSGTNQTTQSGSSTNNESGASTSGTGDDNTSANTDEQDIADLKTPSADVDPALAAVVNKKGTLAITVSGSDAAIRLGSTITLKGTGFAGSANGLTVELHSTPVTIGTINTLADGSFELTATIPDNLETGRHNIVVSYQGYPIIQKGIDVSEVAAPVTSTSGGVPLWVGVVIIAVLAAAAIVLLVFWKVRKSRAQGDPAFTTPSVQAPGTDSQ
jgi:hypothetical protein